MASSNSVLSISDRARQCRRLARKVRAASRIVRKPGSRRELIDIAESYEMLATELKQRATRSDDDAVPRPQK